MSNVVFFDGVDDYVNNGAGASLDLTANLTICCRFKMSYFKGYNGLVAKNNGDTIANMAYQLYLIGGNGVAGLISDGALSNVTTTYVLNSLNRWYHATFVLSTGFLKLYIDGNKVLPDVVRARNPQSQPAWIVMLGGYGTTRFPGVISEVQIYNRDLSDEEVYYNYEHPGNPKRRGLVLNQVQESIYGSQWNDLSGNANNGTYVNGALPMRANLVTQR